MHGLTPLDKPTVVTFTVGGEPIPQPRARTFSTGGFTRSYTPDNGIVAYRQAISLSSLAAGVQQLAGPFEVRIEAVFSRPPSHLLKSGQLRKGAPPIPTRADWDNIAKGVCDSIFKNDSMVAFGSCRKRYAAPGESAHTMVEITSGA
jgi:Holliday junction resolvase RusA-like endonuclease